MVDSLVLIQLFADLIGDLILATTTALSPDLIRGPLPAQHKRRMAGIKSVGSPVGVGNEVVHCGAFPCHSTVKTTSIGRFIPTESFGFPPSRE